MNTDLYTKTVLTVIAIAMILILLRDGAGVVFAQSDRGSNIVKVQIVSIDEAPRLRWDAIPVRVE